MEMFTNVPHIPDKRYAVTDGVFYHESDWVRILLKSKAEYIAEIKRITAEAFILQFRDLDIDKIVYFDEIDKIRMSNESESMDEDPYFDEEEKEFWRTHWYTRNGIERKPNK